jgi:exodeoxyribonuclease VII large subunit
LVVRDKKEIKNIIRYSEGRLEDQMLQILQEFQTTLSYLRKILKEPRKKIEEYYLRVDDLVNRLRLLTTWTLRGRREKCFHFSEGMFLLNPMQKVKNLRYVILEAERHIGQNIKYSIEIKRQNVRGIIGKLDSLSPLSILHRGFSITRKLPSLQILRDSTHVKEGDKVEVQLFQGTLLCGVEKAEKP